MIPGVNFLITIVSTKSAVPDSFVATVRTSVPDSRTAFTMVACALDSLPVFLLSPLRKSRCCSIAFSNFLRSLGDNEDLGSSSSSSSSFSEIPTPPSPSPFPVSPGIFCSFCSSCASCSLTASLIIL